MIGALLASWKYIAIGALVVLLSVQSARVYKEKQRFDTYRANAEMLARLDSEEQRRIETVRQTNVDGEAQHARDEIQALQANVVLLADTADGLRDALAAAKRRARANPGAPVRGARESGADATDMFSELLGRGIDRITELAQYADRLRIAGTSCERAFDAITADSAH